MSFVAYVLGRLRRFRAYSAGTQVPLGGNGEEFPVPVPGDYLAAEAAGNPYIWSVDPSTGLPAWRQFTGGTFIGTGFGTSFGTFGS